MNIHKQVEKRGSTLFLRLAVIAMAAGGFIIGMFFVPGAAKEWVYYFPEIAWARYLLMVGLYTSAIPFYIALYQAMKLLGYIDHNTAFSLASVHALKRIQYCGIVMGIIWMSGMPFIYYFAERDDAPGAILFGMAFAAVPFAVSVFAALLKKLLQNAIDMKAENELTV
jgi:hypothetical protein